jgi:hypothetical protein
MTTTTIRMRPCPTRAEGGRRASSTLMERPNTIPFYARRCSAALGGNEGTTHAALWFEGYNGRSVPPTDSTVLDGWTMISRVVVVLAVSMPDAQRRILFPTGTLDAPPWNGYSGLSSTFPAAAFLPKCDATTGRHRHVRRLDCTKVRPIGTLDRTLVKPPVSCRAVTVTMTLFTIPSNRDYAVLCRNA